jgi:hypothetical protein
MIAKLWPCVVVLSLVPNALSAQESDRTLKGSGPAGAFLTPGQIDRWFFDGEKGETLVVHVVSKQFDPLLGLVKTAAKADETIVADVDDPGTESRFMIRLPEKGEYKIRVRAFKDLAGGNYQLTVTRFQATPLDVGKPLVAAFNRDGKSHHYFQATKDQILVPQFKGSSHEAWTMLDPKGRELPNWAGSVRIDESGECCLIASGQADFRYDLVVREARRHDLALDKNPPSNLPQGDMDVWSFTGKPGDFRLLEMDKKGELASRLIFAPEAKKSETRIPGAGEMPEIQFLPVASRGSRQRYAAILGRAGRYQLQVLATTPATYQLAALDPSVPLAMGKEVGGSLPVGGAAFYRFDAAPGQLFHANLASKQFVPLLRLYDSQGKLVGASGADGDELEGRITHMVVSKGVYRLQVSSQGDGGGGDFAQSLDVVKRKELKIDNRAKGTLPPGGTDFWTFTGKQGQTVFLSVRSASLEPSVSVRSPDGVRLVADNQGAPGAGSLFALRLPKTGSYTVWIASARGAGDYALRLIDGD